MKWFLTVTSYYKGEVTETEEFDSYETAKKHIQNEADYGVDVFVIENFRDDEKTQIEKRPHPEDGDWWQDVTDPYRFQTFWTEQLNQVLI